MLSARPEGSEANEGPAAWTAVSSAAPPRAARAEVEGAGRSRPTWVLPWTAKRGERDSPREGGLNRRDLALGASGTWPCHTADAEDTEMRRRPLQTAGVAGGCQQGPRVRAPEVSLP